MKLRIIYTLMSALALSLLLTGYSGGPATTQNQGYTGAPGDVEASGGTAWTCQTCHNGPLQVTMDIEVFEEGTTMPITDYAAGATYDVKVTINDTDNGAAAYGFQIVSLVDSDESDVNGWSSPGTGVQIATASNTGRSYAEHIEPSSTNVFEVKWTAPAEGAGSVTFYSAGTGVDGNSMNSNDGGSTATLNLTERTVGIFNATQLDARVHVYPNPVADVLNLNIESAFLGEVWTEIMDLQGRVADTRTVNLALGANQERFEVNDLNTGTYLVRLTKDNKVLTTRFVKR